MGDIYEEFMQELPDEYPLKLRKELVNAAKSVITNVNKRQKASFNSGIKGLQPKHGRIPGADETFRSVLSKIAEGVVKSFHEAFDKHFVNTKKDGLKEARKHLFSEIGATIERPTKRRNVDIEAAKDATFCTIRKQVEEEFSSLCGPGYRKKRQTCSHWRQNLMIVEESVRLIGDTIHFETINEEGKRQSHKIVIDLEKLPLAKRTEEYIENLERSGLLEEKETNKAGTSRVQGFADSALGVHGAIVNIFATIHYFSQDDFGKGVFTAAQAAHGIGNLTGVNDVVSKATRIALKKHLKQLRTKSD